MKAQPHPHLLLDTLVEQLGLKNDAQLCRALQIAPPIISKVRKGKVPVSPALLLRMHEVTEMSVKELRWLMGDDPRKSYYRSPVKDEEETV